MSIASRAVPVRTPPQEYRVVLAALVLFEFSVTVAYFAATASTVNQLRYLLYPFVWINVGIAGVLLTRTSDETTTRRLAATGVGVGYFLLVMWLPGNVGMGVGGALEARLAWLAPGWGPVLAVSGPVRLYLIPFEVIGYAALAYLVYANALQLGRSVLSGGLGLVTCVGCTAPLIVPIVGILGGPSTGLASTAYAWSYDLGTVLFVLTVWLLVWGANRSAPRGTP